MKAGPRFTQVMSALKATWDKPHRVQVLAARYYIGVETLESLNRMSKPMPVYRQHCNDPYLTQEDIDYICAMR